jgi:DNA invertase Pin-like site-specific DNA recombinase
MTKKTISKKKFLRDQRNTRIRAVHDGMDGITLQEIADMFKCSVGTVWYAINGREKAKVK